MKPYVIALALGGLVGVVYGVAGVRSPAPPVVALVGLLGMLIGEILVATLKTMMARGQISLSALGHATVQSLLGSTPPC